MTAGGAPGYVQAIPLYLASDTAVAAYFRDHRDEIDAITGAALPVLIAQEIAASDAAGVAAALDARPATRFPGLGFGDLPCLWLEDATHATAVVRIGHGADAIRQTLRDLADICRVTKQAPAIAAELRTRAADDYRRRETGLAALLEGVTMQKSTERLVAVICGVVFVAAILAVALFIPNPTAFQYTVFRIVLSLAAAGFVSMTPGFIEAQVGKTLRAGGALAVFVIVYFYAPAALGALR